MVLLHFLAETAFLGTMRLIEDNFWKKVGAKEVENFFPANSIFEFFRLLFKEVRFRSLKGDIFGYVLVLERFLSAYGEELLFFGIMRFLSNKIVFGQMYLLFWRNYLLGKISLLDFFSEKWVFWFFQLEKTVFESYGYPFGFFGSVNEILTIVSLCEFNLF